MEYMRTLFWLNKDEKKMNEFISKRFSLENIDNYMKKIDILFDNHELQKQLKVI